MVTQVPGSELQVPVLAPWLCRGAVYTTLAEPSLPVTRLRAESVPKSCGTLFTLMSTRSGSDASARPSGPLATIFTADCDPPSCAIESGVAVIERDSASSEGPLSGGASVL